MVDHGLSYCTPKVAVISTLQLYLAPRYDTVDIKNLA